MRVRLIHLEQLFIRAIAMMRTQALEIRFELEVH